MIRRDGSTCSLPGFEHFNACQEHAITFDDQEQDACRVVSPRGCKGRGHEAWAVVKQPSQQRVMVDDCTCPFDPEPRGVREVLASHLLLACGVVASRLDVAGAFMRRLRPDPCRHVGGGLVQA